MFWEVGSLEEIMQFISDAEKILTEQKPSLEQEKQEIINFLQEKYINASILKRMILTGRVKEASSLREKVFRKDYFNKFHKNPQEFIYNLPDLIGIRIVCL